MGPREKSQVPIAAAHALGSSRIREKTMKFQFVLAALALAVSAQAADAPDQASPDLAHSKVFSFDALAVNHMANGGESRQVVTGTLATGEAVSIHESMQPEGLPPNPAHTIEHSEFILVIEGTLEFQHDGVTETAGPGSIIYVAYGTLHRARNVGKGPARYAVIAIGGDVKK
jgi:mannose-6-phosphate isomerase-like protein (cupin superfamily)